MTGKNKAQKKSPKVSIIAISYNHEKYIKQAFDSFLMQATDFDFEVVVGDDCSTDNTQEIINEYLTKYPDIFRQIKREKNIGLQRNFADTMERAKGQYLALCECDDFWTDPYKLQKQADFLDANPDYALCFHPVKVVFEDRSKEDEIYPAPHEEYDFSLKNLLERNFIQTNSAMYRKQSYKSLPTDILPVDWYLHLYHAQFGKIGFIEPVMSTYRRHQEGLWWDSHNNVDEIWRRYGLEHLTLYVEIAKLFSDSSAYRPIIDKNITKAVYSIVKVSSNKDTSLISKVITRYPNIIEKFIIQQSEDLIKTIDDLKKIAVDREYREELVKARDQELARLNQAANAYQAELARVKASRGYKLLRAIGKAKHKVYQLVKGG